MHNYLRDGVVDAQGLALIQAQAYRVEQRVIETRYPDFDYGRLVYVDTTGPEWSPGVLTWTSDMTGLAKWQSGYAKDIPLADVSQNYGLKNFHMAAIGYQWNIEEVNTFFGNLGGAVLPDRRARAARKSSEQFLYSTAISGNVEKNMQGLINTTGVNIIPAPADGTGGVRNWIDANGVGLKTPAQVVRDINLGLMGVWRETYETELADTVLMPPEALTYIAQTPFSATTMETILTFIQRSNIYTQTTGRPLTIRSVRHLSTAATNTSAPSSAGKGRMMVYKNDPETVRFHLPMPFRFLPVHQDGALNFVVPGIFRTGGIEFQNMAAVRYIDGISVPPA